MFIENKYTTIYYQIINQAIHRPTTGYTETHHIIPKSLGGNNLSENLVKLTAREHFICHKLLTRMTTGSAKSKMYYALWRMTTKLRHSIITSRDYDVIRANHAKFLSQEMLGKTWKWDDEKRKAFKERYPKGKDNKLHGIARTEEVKQKISNSNKGQTAWNKGVQLDLSTEDRIAIGRKLSEANLGVKKSDSHKQKISESMSGKQKPRIQCPHCMRVIGGMSNYNRWHGDNCKEVNA